MFTQYSHQLPIQAHSCSSAVKERSFHVWCDILYILEVKIHWRMGQKDGGKDFFLLLKADLPMPQQYLTTSDLCLNCMFLQKHVRLHVTDTIKKGEFAEPFQHLIHSPILSPSILGTSEEHCYSSFAPRYLCRANTKDTVPLKTNDIWPVKSARENSWQASRLHLMPIIPAAGTVVWN